MILSIGITNKGLLLHSERTLPAVIIRIISGLAHLIVSALQTQLCGFDEGKKYTKIGRYY